MRSFLVKLKNRFCILIVNLMEGPKRKQIKLDISERVASLKHGKGRPLPKNVIDKITEEDLSIMESVKSSCNDSELISKAIKVRNKYHLAMRLPEDYDETSYYIQDGLRKVYPYSYLHQAYAKNRWLNKKLKDIFIDEFREIGIDILKKRFESKKILVNGEPVEFEYTMKSNDFISHINHRHELPVLATPIKIIYQDKQTLVIDKPPSIPIHPCGRYRHNSIMNILHKEYGMRNLKPVHRLDRLVSGVLMIAITSQRAHELEQVIKERAVSKQYLCRVTGEFPLGKQEDDGEITVDQPLETIPGKIGITVVMEGGKPSITKFKRLNYNGKTSTVLCKPLTGRMHQIRVHLQYLGYPIANDNLYNSDAFGPERGKDANFGGKSYRQLSADVLKKHRADIWLISDSSNNSTFGPMNEEIPTFQSEVDADEVYKQTCQFISEEEKLETMAALKHYFSDDSCQDLEKKFKFDEEKLVKDPSCRDCSSSFYDPPMRSLYLYLHALRYSGLNWSYESELPNWAKDTWEY